MNRIIITGGPGFGKSTIIHALEQRGYPVFHEVSRAVIQSQKEKDGDIVPWKDHHAFNEVVFKGRLESYHAAGHPQRLYFYDRGLPDSLAYLEADEKEVPPHFMDEIKLCPYFHRVFFTPPWREIYQLDGQRWEDYSYALHIHDTLLRYYRQLGYEIVDVPLTPVDQRVEFILRELAPHFPEQINP